MKIIIKAECQRGGSKFDGLDCQAIFSDYFDAGAFPGVTGGDMSFEYSNKKDMLYVLTTYESTRKLTSEEEKALIDYTQGQWSDGIGEGFEQQVFEELWDSSSGDDMSEYNPSPWHDGQKAELIYQD